MGPMAWRVLAMGVSAVAGLVANKAVGGAWRLASGKSAPNNPAEPDDTSWKEALLYAALAGVIVSVVQTAAERKAAEYYRSSTGHLPAPMQHDED